MEEGEKETTDAVALAEERLRLEREALVLRSVRRFSPVQLSIMAIAGSVLIPLIGGLSCMLFGFHSPTDGGTVTGLKLGESYVDAMSTDGSNRRARVRVKVGQHVQGVHMLRSVAYIDANETSTTGAVLEPKNATNQNMTWRSADPSVCVVEPVNKQSHRVKISGVGYGETVVYGTTEDGGYQTSIRVKVGDYSHATKITDALIDGKGRVEIRVKNISDLDLTRVTVEITAFDFQDKPVEINTKDGSNVVRATYSKRLTPGKTTPADQWKMKDFDEDAPFMHMTVRVVEYQIDNDWVKTIRRNKQPKFVYNP